MRQLWYLGKNLWSKPSFRIFLTAIFAAILGVSVARGFMGSVSLVSGTSMVPTYNPGAWVYTAPVPACLERGDIVVLDDGNKECAIKRIVGLPGELVHIKHGYVFINRKMLLEPYVPKRVYTFPTRLPGAFLLGPDEYFVLGDNRPSSVDSRNYGPVELKKIKRSIPLPEGTVRAQFGSHLLPVGEAILPTLPSHTVSKLERS